MSTSRSSHYHHQKQIGTGLRPAQENVHVHTPHHHPPGVKEFFLKGTYLLFQGRYYEEMHGDAMGSPVNPIVANLFIKKFETNTINIQPTLQGCGEDYVEDTFVTQKTAHRDQFLDHIHSIDHHVQLTTENPNTDGSMPFSDALLITGPENTLLIKFYRKPTNIDQNLH